MEQKKYVAYIGTYTHGSSIGIHIYDMDMETRTLKERSVIPVHNSSYVTKQDFTTNKTVKITPQRAVKYDVVVKVKDAEKTIARSAFTVTVEDLELTNKSTLSASSIYLGENVTVKCAASGGTKPYEYAVSYKKSSSSAYTIKQDYSTNATVKITPQSDTEYTVKISVKDAEGTIKSITKKLNVLM